MTQGLCETICRFEYADAHRNMHSTVVEVAGMFHLSCRRCAIHCVTVWLSVFGAQAPESSYRQDHHLWKIREDSCLQHQEVQGLRGNEI